MLLSVSSASSLSNEADTKTSGKKKSNKESDSLNLSAPHAILLEAKSGTIIYEKDANASVHPASITKIMTLLLIFDAIEDGKIKLTDTVTTSEYAASMGGSQVFLEPGETQSVETMIKCIAVASANDACVTMAEHISGSEEEFVAQMNRRAKNLGMKHTHFVNCCGLDVKKHMTTAYDVALMSRELITKHPQVHDYSTIWMDTITHETKKGSKEFGLANTNKLIRQYQYATGLKTGSTDEAKFCVSATAKKDDLELIAVIMTAPDPKGRFQDASSLLNYGFAKCQLYSDENKEKLTPINVKKGVTEKIPISYETSFQYVDTKGSDLNTVKKEVSLPKTVEAPVKKGAIIGKAIYSLNGKVIGEVNIISKKSVNKAGFKDYFHKLISKFF
ncbi:MAG: D-alanyl-D-alanine carboxypeptidase [Lachnospiraceae bacterium]|nr:D-alanyl-D-alanine carboxypeptidase [Lachnospiraceae bacterium]